MLVFSILIGATTCYAVPFTCGPLYGIYNNRGIREWISPAAGTISPAALFTLTEATSYAAALESVNNRLYHIGNTAGSVLYYHDGLGTAAANDHSTTRSPGVVIYRMGASPTGTIYLTDTTNHVYRYDPVGNTLSASITILDNALNNPTTLASSAGGDLAFDSDSTGYLVTYNSPLTQFRLFRVLALTTATPTATLIGTYATTATIAGIAFSNTDNKLYLQGTNGTSFSWDLANNSLVTLPTTSVGSTDLASCNFPTFTTSLTATKTAYNVTTNSTNYLPNETIEYTITVHNAGDIAVGGTQLTDPIPAGMTYVPNSTTLNGVAVADVGGVMPYAAARPINSPGQSPAIISVGAGADAVIKFRVTVNASPPACISNQGTITFAGDNTNPNGSITTNSATMCIAGTDRSDAPASYGDAAHTFPNPGPPTVYFGSTVPDNDTRVQVTAWGAQTTADGDDLSGNDEHSFGGNGLPKLTVADTTYSLTLACATNGTNVAGWIDFDRSGAFDAAERTSTTCSGGSATLTWTIDSTKITAGPTYVRSRIAPLAADVANPTGLAADGEVEDYKLDIAPLVTINKSVIPTPSTDRFNLQIGGVAFATDIGNGGTTGAKTGYHIANLNAYNAYAGVARDFTLGDVSSAARTVAIAEAVGSTPTVPVTNLADYSTALTCTNAAGTAVTVAPAAGNQSATLTVPQSVTGAGANGRAQNITCTFANTKKPTLTKAFSAGTIGVGQTATLTYTISNPAGASAVTGGLTFTDTFPANLLIAAAPAVVNNCGGTPTITATAGSGSFTVGGAGVNAAAGASTCTISVNVTSSVALSGYVNGAAQITAIANLLNGVTNQTLNVVQAGLNKAFSPTTIDQNSTSTLTFTLSNGAGNPAQSGINFTDTLPTNVVVAATPNVTTTCPSGTGVVTAGSGSGSITVIGASMNSGQASCVITVDVTSSTVGGPYTNNSTNMSGLVRLTNSVTASSLSVQARSSLSKAFTPASIGVGQTSTLTFTITNPVGAPARTGITFTDTFPANVVIASTPNVVNNCGGTPTITATAGSGSITVGGSGVNAALGASTCTITADVTSSFTGTYTNNSTNISGAYSNLDTTGVNATLTIQPTVTLRKTWVNALINDAVDITATGLTTLSSVANSANETDTGAVQTVRAGDTITIAESFTAGSATNYTSTLSCTGNTTALSGSVLTVNGADTSIVCTETNSKNTATVTGRVFRDTGMSGGTANDGTMNGGETGIANVIVKLVNAADNTVFDMQNTDGSGNFTLVIPGTLSTGTLLKIIETNSGGYISTGAGAGTTGGSYNRTADAITFTLTAGLGYSNVVFGDVPENQFLTDGSQTALPGTTVYYPHTFNAASGGTVQFSAISIASPAIPGWSEVLYRDSNCNGQFDSGEPQISAPIAVTAGQQVCILMKEFVPAGAPFNAQNSVTLSAQFSYANAVPALNSGYSRSDLTVVGQPSSGGLSLVKTVDKAAVLPGGTLTYTITYKNQSSDALSTIVINDATPAYTLFVSAVCGGPLPLNLTLCTVSQQPAAGGSGSLQWTLTGNLISGATGSVSYTVQVQN